MKHILNIGKEFHIDPAGRYRSDGSGSGETFREDCLNPRYIKAKTAGEKLVVILDDGVETYGSSFLSEGFGGMVRKGYAEPDELLGCLEFQYENSDYEFYVRKIIEYIRNAKRPSKQ